MKENSLSASSVSRVDPGDLYEDSAGSIGYHAIESTTSSTASASRARIATPIAIKRMRDLTAVIVAERIVEFCTDHGDLVTNLRLQRILYYMQAWHLALHGEPLFGEPFFATCNGVLQPETFNHFLDFGSGSIVREKVGLSVPKKLDEHISEVMRAYGHLSAYDLELLICDEEPWKAARKKAMNESVAPEISITLMKNFYRLRLDG